MTSSPHIRTIVATRHVPERRCLGCGARAPKHALARYVATTGPTGRELIRDDGGRRGGRGLYVCPTRACFDGAVARRAFHRGARLGGDRLVIDLAALRDGIDG